MHWTYLTNLKEILYTYRYNDAMIHGYMIGDMVHDTDYIKTNFNINVNSSELYCQITK